MSENKIIRKYLAFSILGIFITPFWLEGLMGFNRKMNYEFEYGGNLNYRLYDGNFDIYTEMYQDFEPVIFPIALIFVILITGAINLIFVSNYISENWLKPLFKADLYYRIFIIALSVLTIYQFNLTDFWDDNIFAYRLMYLLTLILPITLVYEFAINKGRTVFPQLSYRKKQESNNSEEQKLASLKKMNIINDDTYSTELEKINSKRIFVEIRNSRNYIEFLSNIDFAVDKGLLSEEEKRKKLQEKEDELLREYHNRM
jgi:hypothetical protein